MVLYLGWVAIFDFICHVPGFRNTLLGFGWLNWRVRFAIYMLKALFTGISSQIMSYWIRTAMFI